MKAAPTPGIPHLAVDGGYGLLLGLFPVNWLHNLIHLAIGIAAWSSSRDHDCARQFVRGLTYFYGALAVMGLLPVLNMTFGLIPLYGTTSGCMQALQPWLHILVSANEWNRSMPERITGRGRELGLGPMNSMKHRKKRAQGMKSRRARADRSRTNIRTDSLIKEVEEANVHIANPTERERVIPSRPY